MRHLLSLFALVALACFTLACEPTVPPDRVPGPPGCGLKDPRDTSPGMLSVAQKTVQKNNGDPDAIEKNAHGGLDWSYKVKAGSVFGEQETVTTYSFNAQGLVVKVDTQLVSKVGK